MTSKQHGAARHRCAASPAVVALMGLLVGTLSAGDAAAVTFVSAASGLPPSNIGFDCSSFNPGGWTGVSLGDVDGDGDDDLAAVGRLLAGFHVWLSDGTGNWTPSSLGLDPADCHGRSDIKLADINGDGLLDLGSVRGINGTPGVYLGDGGATWSAASAGLDTGIGEGFTFGDFDGDGRRDLAIVGHFSGGVRAFFGDGAGNWIERSAGLPPDIGGHRAASGDLDGDRQDELVATQFMTGASAIDGVFAYRFDGTSWSLHASWYFDQPYGVAVADANHDGWNDIVVIASQDVVGSFGSVRVLINNGDFRTFTESSTGLPVLDAFYRDLAVGDLDNDGDLDIATGDYGGRYRAFLGDGTGSWMEAPATGLPSSGDTNEGMAAGDLDGDCRIDLALASYRDGLLAYRETDPVPCAILAEAGVSFKMCGGNVVVLDGSGSRVCCPGGAEYQWWQGAVLLSTWSASPVLPVPVSATTVFRLDVACSSDPTCFVTDYITVAVEPDPAPPAIGNVLLLAKSAGVDILHTWTDLAGRLGDYQILALPRALGPPTQAAFDGPLAVVVASALPGVQRAIEVGVVRMPPPLVDYRVRARSACGLVAGPG